jgi:hypothetical protein
VKLRRVPRFEIVKIVCAGRGKGDVDSASLDGRHGAFPHAAQSELDLVREPVRAGHSRANVEVGIADERQPPSRHIALDHVGAGRGDGMRPAVPVGCATRDRGRVEAEVTEERTLRLTEMEAAAAIAG